MEKVKSREIERIKKDNLLLQDRAERYYREIKVYKEFNDKLVDENLKLENEILLLRKWLKVYENRKD